MATSERLLCMRLPGALTLGVGDSLTFQFRREGYLEHGFVLRLAEGYVAFANSCPHWNVDLDLGDERFYDAEIQRIYCKNHGATFLPEDGTCDAGPCLGKSLERFIVRSSDRDVTVEIPEATPA